MFKCVGDCFLLGALITAFLVLAFILEALEVVRCDSFECVRDDLSRRLSW